ncbi:MAG: hypothetical protein AAB669_03360 [Patescibacteria group bacterium]
MRYPSLGDALLWLGVMAGIAIVLGALSRTKLVKTLSKPLLVLASGVYLFTLWQAVAIVPASHWADSWGVAALIVAVSSVFMLGTMLVCSQDISYKNGALGIRHNSLIYRIAEATALSRDWDLGGRSLCKASWSIGGAILFGGVLVGVGAVVNVVIALGFFLYNGSNPFLVWLDAMEDFEIKNRHKRMKYWGNTPRSPGLLLLVLAAVYGIWWVSVTFTPVMVVGAGWLGIMIACAVAFMLFAGFLRLFDSKKKIESPNGVDLALFGVGAGGAISSTVYLSSVPIQGLLTVFFGLLAILVLWWWSDDFRQKEERAEVPVATGLGETADTPATMGVRQPPPIPKPNWLAQAAKDALWLCWSALRLCWSLLLAIKGLACPRIEIT